jgi:hypothetical protein
MGLIDLVVLFLGVALGYYAVNHWLISGQPA